MIFPFVLPLFIMAFYVNAHSTCYHKAMKAQIDVDHFELALELFKEEQGRYPSQSEGLEQLIKQSRNAKSEEVASGESTSYVQRIPIDPWGNPYQYLYPGQHNPDSFDVWSNGADGEPGGEGGDKDCGNWDASDCSVREPVSNLERYAWLFLLFIVSPLVWVPVYVFRAVFLAVKTRQYLKAVAGLHLLAVVVSFIATLVLLHLFMSLGSGC